MCGHWAHSPSSPFLTYPAHLSGLATPDACRFPWYWLQPGSAGNGARDGNGEVWVFLSASATPLAGAALFHCGARFLQWPSPLFVPPVLLMFLISGWLHHLALASHLLHFLWTQLSQFFVYCKFLKGFLFSCLEPDCTLGFRDSCFWNGLQDWTMTSHSKKKKKNLILLKEMKTKLEGKA